MDKIWFENNNGRLEVDANKRFQMTKGSNYVRLKLTQDQIEKLIKFLQNVNTKGEIDEGF